MRGSLRGHSRSLLEDSSREAGERLGLSSITIWKTRRSGVIKATSKTAKAVTRGKFSVLFQKRGNRLSLKQREAIRLVYGLEDGQDPMTVRAAAARLGISAPAVTSRLCDARLKLVGKPSRSSVEKLERSLVWERLTPLQKRVLALHYGLGTEPQTVGEIAQALNRSAPLMRQTIGAALSKLMFDEEDK